MTKSFHQLIEKTGWFSRNSLCILSVLSAERVLFGDVVVKAQYHNTTVYFFFLLKYITIRQLHAS